MKYPFSGKFTTKDEIDNYFGGDKIVCLICGRKFKQLVSHVNRIHGMSTDEYKSRFGLPYTVGLMGQKTKNIYADRIKSLMKSGRIDSDSALAKAHKVRDPRNQRHQDYDRRMSGERIAKAPHEKGILALKSHAKENMYDVETACARCGAVVVVTNHYLISNPGRACCKECARKRQRQAEQKYQKERYKSDEKARLKRNEYMRMWRAKNKKGQCQE